MQDLINRILFAIDLPDLFYKESIPIWIAYVFAILFMLVFFGMIGPKRLKEKMRRMNTWMYRDTALILPVDIHKPISQAFKGAPPFKQRLKNFLIFYAWLMGIVILFIIISFISIGFSGGR